MSDNAAILLYTGPDHVRISSEQVYEQDVFSDHTLDLTWKASLLREHD